MESSAPPAPNSSFSGSTGEAARSGARELVDAVLMAYGGRVSVVSEEAESVKSDIDVRDSLLEKREYKTLDSATLSSKF